MKKQNLILIIILIFAIIALTFLYKAPVENTDNYKNDNIAIDNKQKASSSDIQIDKIFPDKKDFVWYYEGPNDAEKVSMLASIKVEDNKKILTIKSCREDLSGTKKIEDRIFYDILEITKNKIIENGSVILKGPIVKGNTWKTDYNIKPSKEKYKATVEIIEVKDNIIKTKTTVSTKENDIEEQYEETTEYKSGVGVVSQWYNIVGIKGYSQGLDLKKTYEKPQIPDKWYLPPYAIEQSNL